MKLDSDEKKLLKSVESGEWTSVKDLKEYKKHISSSCTKYFSEGSKNEYQDCEKRLGQTESESHARGITFIKLWFADIRA